MADAETSDPLAVSRNYLTAVRRDEAVAQRRAALATLDEAALADRLDGGAATTAFWLNVYNAGVQDRLSRDPGSFEDRGAFFGDRWLTVAGHDLSFDAIEHRLLRRSQWKYGAGYVPIPLPASFERRFRVDDLDPRIHFALNCGAASCPPIRGYGPDRLDEQLDDATRSYLAETVTYEAGGLAFDGVARVPRLFLWYRGDWGRKPAVLRFLRRYDCLPADERPRLSYRPWDWSLRAGDFTD